MAPVDGTRPDLRKLRRAGRPTLQNMTTVVTQNVIDHVLNPMAASATANDQSGLDHPIADPSE
jgi:hypothetical protein